MRSQSRPRVPAAGRACSRTRRRWVSPRLQVLVVSSMGKSCAVRTHGPNELTFHAQLQPGCFRSGSGHAEVSACRCLCLCQQLISRYHSFVERYNATLSNSFLKGFLTSILELGAVGAKREANAA